MAATEWTQSDMSTFVDACCTCGRDYDQMRASYPKLRPRRPENLRALYMSFCAQVALALYSATQGSSEVDSEAGQVLGLQEWQRRASRVLAGQANIFGCFLRCFWKVRTLYHLKQSPSANIVAPVEGHLLQAFNRDVCEEIRNTEGSLLTSVMALISERHGGRGGAISAASLHSPLASSPLTAPSHSPPGAVSPCALPQQRVIRTTATTATTATKASALMRGEEMLSGTAYAPPKDIRMSVNNLGAPSAAKLALKLVPRTAGLAARLSAAGFNPNLQLNLGHKKPAAMVAKHINNKWRQVLPVGFELRVYPMPGSDNTVNSGWGREHSKVTMGSLFASLNCTTELQLQYDLAERKPSTPVQKKKRQRPPAPAVAVELPRSYVRVNLEERFGGAHFFAMPNSTLADGSALGEPLPEFPEEEDEPKSPEQARTASSVVGNQNRTGSCGMVFSYDEASRDGFTNIWSTPEAASAFERRCEEYDDTSMPATMFSDRFREATAPVSATAGGLPASKRRRRQ